MRDEIVCIDTYGESCIRVRSTRNRKLSEEKWTLLDAEKSLIELRERFKSYILESAKLTSETGEPIMGPMFFDFPEDEKYYTISDRYMFRRDILFTPIYNQGQTERSVYLPEDEWIPTSDRRIFTGGQEIVCHAEINEFIAFVKKIQRLLMYFKHRNKQLSAWRAVCRL